MKCTYNYRCWSLILRLRMSFRFIRSVIAFAICFESKDTPNEIDEGQENENGCECCDLLRLPKSLFSVWGDIISNGKSVFRAETSIILVIKLDCKRLSGALLIQLLDKLVR